LSRDLVYRNDLALYTHIILYILVIFLVNKEFQPVIIRKNKLLSVLFYRTPLLSLWSS